MSGSEGRCERECSGGEGLLGGDGEVDRPVGGRGAADRDPGGRSADLPSEPPAGPSVWKTERQCLSALGKKSQQKPTLVSWKQVLLFWKQNNKELGMT